MIVLVTNERGTLDADLVSTVKEAREEVVTRVRNIWDLELDPEEDLADQILEHDLEFDFEIVEFEKPDEAIATLRDARVQLSPPAREALDEVLEWLS